jgi:hypothetical protein
VFTAQAPHGTRQLSTSVIKTFIDLDGVLAASIPHDILDILHTKEPSLFMMKGP